MKILMLLPAFNEEDSIPALLPRIREAMETGGFDYRVVLVDDGSRDETAARAERFAREMPIDILRHPINRGLGETIRDGIEHCVRIGGPGDIVVRMDCDDSQDPAYVATLVEKIQGGCDVVVTSRYQPGGGQSGVEGHRHAGEAGGLSGRPLFQRSTVMLARFRQQLPATLPLIVAASFWRRRDAFATSIALVWLFQNFFNIARYMADARARVLPLVGGDHDWTEIFTRWHVLHLDTRIAGLVGVLGWAGLLMTCCALARLWWRQRAADGPHSGWRA